MSKTYSVSRLGSIKVKQLLGDCLSHSVNLQEEDSEQMREHLQEELTEKCPLSAQPADRSTTIMEHIQLQTARHTGCTVGECLADPQTDIHLLVPIKDYYKDISHQTLTRADHHVAIAIYFGAVAHALVYHDQKISDYSYRDLQQSFCTLMQYDWMVPQLKILYQHAQGICEEQARNT
ncbi:hypothetical protein ACFL6U_18470 [Planctomycetota bacterium]